MTLLIPLGLLGLLSIAGLILIYIIKPNYQQKYISSTYVWALSLKLKKKRLPVSKLRNLLLILCQILFLVMCALALAQPALITRAAITEREVIAIIDSSASMRTTFEDETRFQRAVGRVADLANDVFDADGYVTVIVAGDTPEILAQRARAQIRGNVEEELLSLSENDECSYGEADYDAAMAMCEEIVSDNANAEIYLYTDTDFAYIPSGVNVVNVAEEGEWNAGILNAYTVLEDNYYSVFVEIACYGASDSLPLTVQVQNVNAAENTDGEGGPVASKTVTLRTTVNCSANETMTVVFRNGNIQMEDWEENAENIVFISIASNDRFYSYGSIRISLDVEDSFRQDDTFSLYDGEKQVLKVQYASPEPNNFVNGILTAMARYYRTEKNVWDIQITEVHENPATTGFDLYIFEHTMPSEMPQDGIVILWDLDTAPVGSGLALGEIRDYSSTGVGLYLTEEQDSPLLANVTAGNISVSRFTTFLSYDPSYQVLLSCDSSPVLLAKNEGDSKVVVMPFSVHYSNFGISFVDYVALFYNLFETWIPSTVTGSSFAVYEQVSLNARGDSLTVTSTSIGDSSIVFTEFPATLELDLPGTYTLSQTTDFGKQIEENIYVKIPSAESNIWSTEDTFRNPFLAETNDDYYEDIILYVAAAFVALLFVEWILQSRENL